MLSRNSIIENEINFINNENLFFKLDENLSTENGIIQKPKSLIQNKKFNTKEVINEHIENKKRNNNIINVNSNFDSINSRENATTSNKHYNLNRKISLKSPTKSTCTICFDELKEKAILNNCSHEYCYGCIRQWANNSNKCPLCKTDFLYIIHFKNKKRIREKIKTREFISTGDSFIFEDSNNGDSDNEEDNCILCDEKNLFEKLIYCDGCEIYCCHLNCCNLSDFPEEEWFCPNCLVLFAIDYVINFFYLKNDDSVINYSKHQNQFIVNVDYYKNKNSDRLIENRLNGIFENLINNISNTNNIINNNIERINNINNNTLQNSLPSNKNGLSEFNFENISKSILSNSKNFNFNYLINTLPNIIENRNVNNINSSVSKSSITNLVFPQTEFLLRENDRFKININSTTIPKIVGIYKINQNSDNLNNFPSNLELHNNKSEIISTSESDSFICDCDKCINKLNISKSYNNSSYESEIDDNKSINESLISISNCGVDVKKILDAIKGLNYFGFDISHPLIGNFTSSLGKITSGAINSYNQKSKFEKKDYFIPATTDFLPYTNKITQKIKKFRSRSLKQIK